MKEAESYLPFGRFKSMKDVIVWAAHLDETTFFDWNLDRIQHEWKNRLSFLQEWMETD